MLKRIAYFTEIETGRYLITNISDVVDSDNVMCPTINDLKTSVYIDADYSIPPDIEFKYTKLYYNMESKSIDVEYIDIPFDELTSEQKSQMVYDENSSLKSELNLTQAALFEVVNELEKLKGVN